MPRLSLRRFCSLLLVGLLGSASANSYVPPSPLLIGSSWGAYGFKFLPQGVSSGTPFGKATRGELFQLQSDSSLKTLWKRTLVNTPSRILISPRGHVVTLDNWAGRGSPNHAVVIYDQKGKVTVDLTYAQVMRGSPPCNRCSSMDGPFLTWGYRKIDFTSYGLGDEWFLILRDEQGKGPTISLTTGKLKQMPKSRAKHGPPVISSKDF